MSHYQLQLIHAHGIHSLIHVCTLWNKEPEGPQPKELNITDLHQVVHWNTF